MNYKLIQTSNRTAEQYVNLLLGGREGHECDIRIVVEDDKPFVEDYSSASRVVRYSFSPDVEVKTDKGFTKVAHESFFEALNKLGGWYIGTLMNDCAIKLEVVVEEAKQNGQYVSP